MEDLQLNVEDAENRAEWRRRTRVADPHLRDPQPEGEREFSSVGFAGEKTRRKRVVYAQEFRRPAHGTNRIKHTTGFHLTPRRRLC